MTRRVSKPLVFTLCLLPLGWVVWLALNGGLGANPIEAVNRFLGDWALRFLLIALAVTPLVKLSGWSTPMKYRRMLGLFAFAYASLHVANYVIADQAFVWADIWADIVKRRFITVGMAVFIILVVLAATSPKAVVRRLGGKRWRTLHRGVYLAAIGAVPHYAMMIKADLLQPALHGGVLIMLLGLRLRKR